jgi:alkylhydroperoxidase/carboxymuconolactone decarboxylase family protein YurZ
MTLPCSCCSEVAADCGRITGNSGVTRLGKGCRQFASASSIMDVLAITFKRRSRMPRLANQFPSTPQIVATKSWFGYRASTTFRMTSLAERATMTNHLTRSGIDVPTRELLTFSMLVSLGGCDPQVKRHVAANLHVGNSRAKLIDVLTQLLPFIGYPRTLNGLRAVDEVTSPESQKPLREK